MDKNLQIWEAIYSSREWGKYPNESLVRFIARNFYRVPDRSKVKILELGSGTGANLWYIAREGFSVYGIEGSPTGVKLTIERLKTDGLEARIGEIVSGDYQDLPWHVEIFDAVVDVVSLYSNPFDKARSVVENSFACIKPGGRFFSRTFAAGSDGLPTDQGFIRLMTEADIEKLYKARSNEFVGIELEDRRLVNGKHIREWVVEMKKLS